MDRDQLIATLILHGFTPCWANNMGRPFYGLCRGLTVYAVQCWTEENLLDLLRLSPGSTVVEETWDAYPNACLARAVATVHQLVTEALWI